MTWHDFLSLTLELKECFYSLCHYVKNGEADELQLRWGNFYDTINFTEMK